MANSPNPRQAAADAAFRRFARRVWRDDVAPLLRGRLAAQREKTATLGGQVAGSAGRLLDRALGLRGQPFARALTIMGASLGAMLPDAWDWDWLQDAATPAQRRTVRKRLERHAAELDEAAALALFGLEPQATHAEFRAAWRAASLLWHPDKARTEEQRRAFTIRFAALCAARDQIEAAFSDGRLPV